jgi:hypothetical protein
MRGPRPIPLAGLQVPRMRMVRNCTGNSLAHCGVPLHAGARQQEQAASRWVGGPAARNPVFCSAPRAYWPMRGQKRMQGINSSHDVIKPAGPTSLIMRITMATGSACRGAGGGSGVETFDRPGLGDQGRGGVGAW